MRSLFTFANAALLAGSALMGTAAFAAELSEGKPYEGTELNVLAVKSSQFEAHEARLADFEEKTGITVRYDYVPFPNMREALTAEMVGGAGGYDVVSVMDQWVPSMALLLDPIEEGIEARQIDLSNWPDAHLNQGRIDGALNGLPVRGHVQLMFYRKDVLDELGLEPPKTWTEVVEASKAIQDATDMAGIALPYGKGNAQNLMVWYDLLTAKGGALFDADGNPVFNSEAAVAATEDYIGFLTRDEIVPPGSAGFVEQDAVNSFKQGNAAMLPVWWWVRSQLTDPEQSKLTEEQIGFVAVPTYEGSENKTYTNTWVFGVTETSDKKDAAMEFLTWLTDPALEKEVLLDESLTEVVAVQLPNLEDEAVNARWGGMHQAAATALRGATPLVYTEEWAQISEILETTISSLAADPSLDAKDALDEAAERVEAIR